MTDALRKAKAAEKRARKALDNAMLTYVRQCRASDRASEGGEMKPKYPHPRVYTWECDLGLCHWAEPRKDTLLMSSKPSPEAVIRLVRLVPEAEYRRMMAKAVTK